MQTSVSCVVANVAPFAKKVGLSRLWLHEAVVEGEDDGRRSVAEAELGEDVSEVALHGHLADVQSVGHFGVRETTADELQDLTLSRRQGLDDSALRAQGYAPRTPFAEGLAGTVRWYVDHRDWWEPLKQPGAAAR
jgi:hypothetical protein